MRRLVALVSAAGLLVGSLIVPAAASANNDPHRFLLEQGSLDFPAAMGFCAFDVHSDVLVNREYVTETVLEDGTDIMKFTGSLVIELTRPGTDKSVVINAGGPGTYTFAPDGHFSGIFFGRSLLMAPNLTDFGLPSNLVATAGSFALTQEPGEIALATMTGHPHVITDVCAALA